MNKITLAVPWGQYDLITENTFRHQYKNSICDQSVFIVWKIYLSAQYTNTLLLTLIKDHLAVFFASGVTAFTASESVLFVLRSQTKKASLAP